MRGVGGRKAAGSPKGAEGKRDTIRGAHDWCWMLAAARVLQAHVQELSRQLKLGPQRHVVCMLAEAREMETNTMSSERAPSAEELGYSSRLIALFR